MWARDHWQCFLVTPEQENLRNLTDLVLVSAEDQGSSNFSASWFLTCWMQLSYVYIPDHSHRVANDLKGALKAAHLWPMILKTIMGANFVYAPWQGCGFWNQMMDVLQDLPRLMAADATLWNEYWPRIASDLGLDVADVEARETLIGCFKDEGILTSKGTKVGQCRWFSWNHWMTEKDREWRVRAFVLEVLCRLKGLSVNRGSGGPAAGGHGVPADVGQDLEDAIVPAAAQAMEARGIAEAR